MFWFLFAVDVEEAFTEGSRDIDCGCDAETYLVDRAPGWDEWTWRPFPTAVLLRLGVQFTCRRSVCSHVINRTCTQGCGYPVSFDVQDIGTTDEDHYDRSAYCCVACSKSVGQ